MNISAALSKYWTEFIVLFVLVSVGLSVFGLLAVTISWWISTTFSSSKLRTQAEGKNCLVTGGSRGLGKAVAEELVKAGAHVTIVATTQTTLASAVKELKKLSVHSDQVIQYKQVDLTSFDDCTVMVEELLADGRMPDWIFCNAGSSAPGFLASQIPEKVSGLFKKGLHEWMIETNYYTSLNVVRAVVGIVKSSRDNHSVNSKNISGIPSESAVLPGKIVLVGSMLSNLTFIGMTAYSASKYALLGFGEALRSEFLPLGVDVYIYNPGTMDTPGLAAENVIKPQITKEIEGSSSVASPSSAAKVMLAGILNERFYISNEFLGELLRVSVAAGPRPNLITEVLATPLLAVAFFIWLNITDMQVKSHFAY